MASSTVCINGRLQRLCLHRTIVISLDLYKIVTPDTRQEHRLFNRGMCVAAGIDAQLFLAEQSDLFGLPVQRLVARRQDRRQGGETGPALNDPVPPLADAGHLAQPVQHMRFHFGAGRRCLPQHALRSQRCCQPFGQYRGRAGIGRKIRKKPGMLPIRHMWHNQCFKIGKHSLDRLRVHRRDSGQAGAHVARARCRTHRPVAQTVQILS